MINDNYTKNSKWLSDKELDEELDKQVKEVQLMLSSYKKENKKEQDEEER